ncbi:MAG: hypothetical protein PHT32_04375 [Candidatus Omnitrophica bacterium]|nr:hypothetical protein [Candidatus Omnitrophota bacterium]
MIVVLVIAIILAIVVPNYLKTGRAAAKNACINNLKQIDGAIEQWALDNTIQSGTQPSIEQEEVIYVYIDGGKPACPSKGVYTIYPVGDKPQVRCSKESEGHTLP